ncbi:MAG: macrolide transporter, partial [Elusimicrobia bacterium CG08_land_8_20_14_0_20_59_10]
SGRIEEILVEEGEKIEAGEVLALMSSSDRVAILDAARAAGDDQYAQWKETYKPIKLIAPISGTLILKNVVEGQTVGGSTVLFAVSDKLILEATVDESDIGKIKPGQQAGITLDAYPDKLVTGKVFQILDEGATSNNVITYKVKIRPDRVPSFFKSQMTANIKVRISAGRKVILIPFQAVVIGPSGATSVITSIKGGKPAYTDIVTGANEGKFVEVTSGLEDGAPVYYTGRAYRPQQDDASGANPLMPRMNRRGASTGGARSGGVAAPAAAPRGN